MKRTPWIANGEWSEVRGEVNTMRFSTLQTLNG